MDSWLSVEDDGRGVAGYGLDVDDLVWAALPLGLVGADFTVVAPPELSATLRTLAARFATASRAARKLLSRMVRRSGPTVTREHT